ncbi:fatty acid-binding protein, muscle-like [Mizuhopecten yessoensis]|uniref:Fatty acid-binding protein, muscle n=1 Tax=Mizuhopecten yessoensis TaxID=6573 RepID=A0A210QCV8_MIZYE|nr:fatty acid-binding protein, muscle-like [Mizuhopecten yessoensis]OWF46550.1 Fatty acid-binding protein, muscle [Mizuhopecten yessoensis]
MAVLNGKWKLASVDNFAPYLDAIGASGEDKQRGLQGLSADHNIVQEITIDGTSVTIKTTTPLGSTESKATIGQEADQKSMDGRDLKVTYTIDGNSLVESQTGAYTSTNTRSVSGSEMIMTMTSGGVTTTRKYNKQ